MKTSLILASFTSFLSLAVAEDLQSCGNARYYPSKYSCFGTQLCPKTSTGEATIACGQACYDAGTYYCDSNTQLQLITPDAKVQFCGTAPYKPGQYTCQPGNFLCPVIKGEATLNCGNACYNPREYNCVNEKLGNPGESTPQQPTCGTLYATCGYNGDPPCCSDKYFCAASKCRPFSPPKMVKKSVLDEA